MRMLADKPARQNLAKFMETLQAHGRYTFTKNEAVLKLQISNNAFHKAAFRLVHQRRLIRVTNGFYLIIPVEYQLSGGLPPTAYIDSLMKFRKQPYYVGILSAAALHGAAHQSPQELQVVTSLPLRPIRAGRGKIHYFTKKRISSVPVQPIKTSTGYLQASTPEATALDLLLYVRAAGHLNNVATVLTELAEKIDPKKLLLAAQSGYDLSVVQRLGYLLERFTKQKLTSDLFQWVKKQEPEFAWLSPVRKSSTGERNEKWRLILNEEVEPDL